MSKVQQQLLVIEAAEWFCEVWLRINNRSAKTIASYQTDLKQFVNHVGEQTLVDDISREEIESWILELQRKGFMPSSIRRKLASLRGLFRQMTSRLSSPRSPFDGLYTSLGTSSKLTKIIDSSSINALLLFLQNETGSCDSDSAHQALRLRDYAMIRLLAATGIRVGELCSLDWPDLAIDQGKIKIHGKGDRERLAFLILEEDRRSLMQYARKRNNLKPCDTSFFLNSRGTRISTEGVRTVLRRVGEQAGLANRITPHMLRHTAATRLLENGADIRMIQAFLGHRSIRSTERYTHVATSHLQVVLERCHPLLQAA